MSLLSLGWEKRAWQEMQRIVKTNKMRKWEKWRKRKLYERLMIVHHFCNSFLHECKIVLHFARFVLHCICNICIYVCMYDNIWCMHKRTMILFRENSNASVLLFLFRFFFLYYSLYFCTSINGVRKEQYVISRNTISEICYQVFINKII